MRNKKLQQALKYKELTKKILDLELLLSDEVKIYLSYPEDTMFPLDNILGILLGIIEHLLPIGKLSMDNLLSLTDELKKS
tara:strand:- start:807 stop:1046 length:240 start_codon:yes stop_codon:yes gene_type:complete